MTDTERPRKDVVIEEVEWLASFGETFERVAPRVGYSRTEHLERVLYGWKRRDLIARLRNNEDR